MDTPSAEIFERSVMPRNPDAGSRGKVEAVALTERRIERASPGRSDFRRAASDRMIPGPTGVGSTERDDPARLFRQTTRRRFCEPKPGPIARGTGEMARWSVPVGVVRRTRRRIGNFETDPIYGERPVANRLIPGGPGIFNRTQGRLRHSRVRKHGRESRPVRPHPFGPVSSAPGSRRSAPELRAEPKERGAAGHDPTGHPRPETSSRTQGRVRCVCSSSQAPELPAEPKERGLAEDDRACHRGFQNFQPNPEPTEGNRQNFQPNPRPPGDDRHNLFRYTP